MQEKTKGAEKMESKKNFMLEIVDFNDSAEELREK